jgi:alkylation response protein AidB-like acyl-CoA dehydrogenase
MNALDLKSICQRADIYDQTGAWPSGDLDVLAAAGAMGWAIPAAFGGDDLDPLELHFRYEQIATASLSTALVLTQRDSAVGMILASENITVRNELLPLLVTDCDLFESLPILRDRSFPPRLIDPFSCVLVAHRPQLVPNSVV